MWPRETRTEQHVARPPAVALRRRYAVLTVDDARRIAATWLDAHELTAAVTFGLPEVDDRIDAWRVPLVSSESPRSVGEIVVDARSTLILTDLTTQPTIVERRLLHRPDENKKSRASGARVVLSDLRNTIAQGDSETVLQELPADSVDLIFTSPPYYNARPEYTEYPSYEDYLHKLRRIIQQCHRVLSPGRMFVINVSPVLIRRISRNHSSQRLAVPFDLHRIFTDEGFDFMDDIIWMKPEGAGWATGRGRRFAADRNPMQYKAVPVTEYVLVYRKHTDKLIDWHIRSHPDQDIIEASKIPDGYERTNVWKITPTSSSLHPAIFPQELAERVIRYYSFIGDIVLDPFAGIGTTGAAAAKLGRRFALVERETEYVDTIRQAAVRWLGTDANQVLCLNCPPLDGSSALF